MVTNDDSSIGSLRCSAWKKRQPPQLIPHLELSHSPFRKGQDYDEQVGDGARRKIGNAKDRPPDPDGSSDGDLRPNERPVAAYGTGDLHARPPQSSEPASRS